MKSKEVVYGRYVIRTLAVGPTVKARAFSGRTAVADAEGDTYEAAVLSMQEVLDQRDAEQRAARKDAIPTADEFFDCFNRVDEKVGRHHWLMLKALYGAPDRTLTAGQIAAAAGYDSYSTTNYHFGVLGKMLAEDLGYEPARRADGTTIWTSTLATAADPGVEREDRQWQWRMRDEVANALRRLNVGAKGVGDWTKIPVANRKALEVCGERLGYRAEG